MIQHWFVCWDINEDWLDLPIITSKSLTPSVAARLLFCSPTGRSLDSYCTWIPNMADALACVCDLHCAVAQTRLGKSRISQRQREASVDVTRLLKPATKNNLSLPINYLTCLFFSESKVLWCTLPFYNSNTKLKWSCSAGLILPRVQFIS